MVKKTTEYTVCVMDVNTTLENRIRMNELQLAWQFRKTEN